MLSCYLAWREMSSKAAARERKTNKIQQQRLNEFKRVFLENLSLNAIRRKKEKFNIMKIKQKRLFNQKKEVLTAIRDLRERQARFRALMTGLFANFMRKAFLMLNYNTSAKRSINTVTMHYFIALLTKYQDFEAESRRKRNPNADSSANPPH